MDIYAGDGLMKSRKKRRIIVLIMVPVILFFCWLQNNWLVVSQYTYASEMLPKEFEGYRIVQISDLHNVSFGSDNSRLLKKIQELSPDMVVVTGDVVDSNHTNLEVAITFAKQVASEYPTYYVTGNHENWLEDYERTELMNGLKNAGVICLADEAVKISREGSSITLVGLNDESLSGPTLKLVLTKMDEAIGQRTPGMDGDDRQERFDEEVTDFQILLAHEPQYLENYSEAGVDLVLTGHAHGGQFRFPIVGGGLVAPDQGFFPKYSEGMHEMGSTTMIISRGLGNSIIPVRLFNLPEIVCVELGR